MFIIKFIRSLFSVNEDDIKPYRWLVDKANEFREANISNANHYEKRLLRKLCRLYDNDLEYQKIVYYRAIDGSIKFYIVDFLITSLNVVIEADGVQHYTRDGREYDKDRTKVLESLGYSVVRVKNEEIFKLKDSVLIERINKAYRRKR